MVLAPGVAAAPAQAESMRRRLAEAGRLRQDLHVLHEGDRVVFPVVAGEATFDFAPRHVAPARYADLLDWPEAEKAKAPRAFDQFGDILVVKVPEGLAHRAKELGEALLGFHPAARAVFHDRGVHGPFRTRDLVAIAGHGGTRTEVAENHVRLVVDPARAYFSPRLADERARVAGMLRPGDRLIDLFGGVAPLGVQAARAGAEVESVDLNPAAVKLAKENVRRHHVEDRVRLHLGDARDVAARLPPADHVVTNLPHGASSFLDAAVPLVRPGGMLHHHQILDDAGAEARRGELEEEIHGLGREAAVRTLRHVRAYAAGVSHYAFDIVVGEAP